MTLKTHDLNNFLGNICFGDDVFQNMFFFYQPTLDILKLKKTRALIMLLVGNCTSKLTPLYTAFFHSIKLSRYSTVSANVMNTASINSHNKNVSKM